MGGAGLAARLREEGAKRSFQEQSWNQKAELWGQDQVQGNEKATSPDCEQAGWKQREGKAIACGDLHGLDFQTVSFLQGASGLGSG